MGRRLLFILTTLLPLLANGQWASATNHDNVFVRLSWGGITPPVTLARQFSFDNDFQVIAETEGDSYDDTVRRCLCQDTIRYRLTAGQDTLFALSPFTDDRPTTMPAIEVCSVDSLSQRIHLRWSASPDRDIMGYVLCARDDAEAPWLAVDTLWSPADTALTLDESPLQRHFYRLYAFDSCLTASAMTEPFGNIVLEADANGASGAVELRWSGGEGMAVGSYRVELVCIGDEGPQPASYSTTQAQSHSLTVPQGTARARLTVVALSPDGRRQSRSNSVECLFHIPPPPDPPDTTVAPPPEVVEEETVWIPSAFTPEESTNTRFCLQTTGLRDYQLSLFDRMGRQIYHTDDPAACWDGRLANGVKAPTGAYVYRLAFLDPHGSPQIITGTVLLIR